MSNRFGVIVRRWATTLLVAGMGFAGIASATLLDRGPDMVYDDVLNITWTRQAGDGVTRNWADADAFAAALVFGGFDDWRLPYASVIAGVGPTQIVVDCATSTEMACRDNEMGYMFYYNLDGNPSDNKTGTQTAVGGEMLTGIGTVYWSGTEYIPGDVAWDFYFVDGIQAGDSEGLQFFAWAVRAGDVAAVPEPATLALLAFGLAGLGFSRRRH